MQCNRPQFNSWVRKIPWRRDRLPTPVFLGFPVGSDSKGSACNAETCVQSLGWEDSPGERHGNQLQYQWASLVAQEVKNLPAMWEARFSPWVGKTPGEGNGNSLQYSCLGNPKDREAWKATVHGVSKSWM